MAEGWTSVGISVLSNSGFRVHAPETIVGWGAVGVVKDHRWGWVGTVRRWWSIGAGAGGC
ncbi:hypothetical protein M758_10G166300 [Ceratodon purpureus]|uniref:Uncharacterized protein n=1 Tax=Ceratodon purpureus TaxID=3225 RepID=A0A8T0GMY9_CERPU|nr:hypothetical protein KC19_10G171200 [Ceratodon purpureus]KAG0604362.1 hypothetical protein M758_10G166300 [Ceratodon purpureus]